MLRYLFLAGLGSMALAPAAAAQWAAGLEAGADRIVRMIEPRPGSESVPGRAALAWPLAARIERGGEGWRVGATASVVNPALELEGPTVSVQLRPAFRIITIAPEVSARLARLPHGGTVRLHLGLPLERWAFTGYADPPRWRVGVAASAALELPLVGALAARVGVGAGTLLRNPLTETELTEEYTTTAVWRRSLRVGMLWRP